MYTVELAVQSGHAILLKVACTLALRCIYKDKEIQPHDAKYGTTSAVMPGVLPLRDAAYGAALRFSPPNITAFCMPAL